MNNLSCECKDPKCFLDLTEEEVASWGILHAYRVYREMKNPGMTYLIIHQTHANDSDFFIESHGNLILIVEED